VIFEEKPDGFLKSIGFIVMLKAICSYPDGILWGSINWDFYSFDL
jgi:hypothetical protein